MNIERCDHTPIDPGGIIPPRVFLTLTANEVEHAIRAFADEQGVHIPPGEVHLVSGKGFCLRDVKMVIEHAGPLEDIEHIQRVDRPTWY